MSRPSWSAKRCSSRNSENRLFKWPSKGIGTQTLRCISSAKPWPHLTPCAARMPKRARLPSFSQPHYPWAGKPSAEHPQSTPRKKAAPRLPHDGMRPVLSSLLSIMVIYRCIRECHQTVILFLMLYLRRIVSRMSRTLPLLGLPICEVHM